MDRPAPFMIVIANHVGLRASPAATVVCLGCLSGGHEKSCVSRPILWRRRTQNNHMRYPSFAASRQSPKRSRLGDPEALFSDSGQIVPLLTLKDEWSASE